MQIASNFETVTLYREDQKVLNDTHCGKSSVQFANENCICILFLTTNNIRQ